MEHGNYKSTGAEGRNHPMHGMKPDRRRQAETKRRKQRMNIAYSKRAAKSINSMNSRTKQRMKTAIEGIPTGDIEPLKGSKGSYRLRVGGWRIIFSYPAKDTVLIDKIEPQGEVYKGGV